MRYIITALLTSATVVAAEVPAVVTDIPPVHGLVAQVMGGVGTPTLLLAKGADEHDFALLPSQAADVEKAELIVWIGPQLTPWLDAALENRREAVVSLALLDAAETTTRGYAAEDATPDTDDHGHAGADLHVWLDPDNAKLWLPLIAAELSRIDPGNAAAYTANAGRAAAEIDDLDAEVAAILAPAKDKRIVTFHDAFGYFAAHYGLTVAGSIAPGDAAPPGAQRLSELRDILRSGKVICLFPEAQQDPALVSQMADGTGVRIGGALDPVGSSLDPGPGAYAAMLTGIARTIADCVGG